MSNNNLKLENFQKQIASLKKINISEAKDIYQKIISTENSKLKKLYMDELILGTLYVIVKYLKNSNLNILENSSYDMDDIISSTIEFYINEINNGSLLKVSYFSDLFGRTYYTYLNSIFALQKDNIEKSDNIIIDNFGDLMEVFLELRCNKEDVSFTEYLDKVKNSKFGSKFDDCCFNNLKNYFYKCFEMFENIYLKTNIDDNNIPSKTKLKFMRDLLIDITLTEDISLANEIEYDFETEFTHNQLIKDSIDYIINDSGLEKREIDILIKRNGIDDGHIKTLDQIRNIYGISRNRVSEIEAKALCKLRHPFRRKNINID